MNTISFVKLKQVINTDHPYENIRMTSTNSVASFAREYIGDNDRETLIAIGVSTNSAINFVSTISIGSLNSTIATPRELFKTAILSNCSRLILAHNHPSYDLTPSEADISFTRRIQKAGELLGVEILDHLIVNPTEYFSFLGEGYLGNGGIIYE